MLDKPRTCKWCDRPIKFVALPPLSRNPNNRWIHIDGTGTNCRPNDPMSTWAVPEEEVGDANREGRSE